MVVPGGHANIPEDRTPAPANAPSTQPVVSLRLVAVPTTPPAILYYSYHGGATIDSKPTIISPHATWASSRDISLRGSSSRKIRSSVTKALSGRARNNSVDRILRRRLERSWSQYVALCLSREVVLISPSGGRWVRNHRRKRLVCPRQPFYTLKQNSENYSLGEEPLPLGPGCR